APARAAEQPPHSATLDRASTAVADENGHLPFVPASVEPPELTVVPVLMGSILGIVFGASSMYLVLKVGLTVSASIPVAVLSITIFRALSKVLRVRNATILENNIVQTTGSAGESIAFGVGVTMPALLILGYNLEIGRVMLVSVLGGLLGILMMIPLRRALIVKEHKNLVYPEGTACAEVLIVGEKGGTTAKTVFAGFGVGGLFKFLYSGLKLWKDVPGRELGSWYPGGALSIEVAPELLGVGYIIGTRTAMIMGAGGILSSLVLIPAIKLFGGGLDKPVYPATELIGKMDIGEVWHSYVLYIGAGAVAAGGIISLVKSLPIIVSGAMRGIQSLRGSGGTTGPARTDKDLPIWLVGAGSLVIVLACWLAPSLKLNLLGGVLIIVFGFLFVTVSSRLTGEIGSSSNPISGMTVATLLLTSLIFLGLGWTSAPYKVTALSVAAIVCISASNGGTTSQDLKTGYLIGATPWKQQVAILIGAFLSAIFIGFVILALNDAGTVYAKKSYPDFHVNVAELTEPMEKVRGPEAASDAGEYHVFRLREPREGVPAGKYLVDGQGQIRYLVDPGINGAVKARDNGTPVTKYSAPKAMLMSFIIDGIMSQKLPWSLVLIGAFISIVLELCGISSLAFAVGVYLPLSTSTPIMLGGLVRYAAERTARRKMSEAEAESGPGVLASSGLIAGGAIAGTLVAFLSFSETIVTKIDLSRGMGALAESDLLAFVLFLGLAGFLYLVANEFLLKGKAEEKASG
ncbi:MAG TPA: oligopeptide transporter, OPT family, partial [Myxococcales bacterium]|nr:oligopeptide transporter, OPT family [Myxococcales bacterium]